MADIEITTVSEAVDIDLVNDRFWMNDVSATPDVLKQVAGTLLLAKMVEYGIGDADAAAQRTTLGLAIGANVQAYDADLSTIAGLTATTDNFMQAKSSAWASRTPSQVAAV